jgi:hypothetical protein
MEYDVAIAMAGSAAEKLVLEEPSTGAEVDLERATDIARDMAGRYGMSDRLGPARVLRQHGEVFLGRDYMSTQEMSQPTLESLDAEVRRIMEEQEQVAATILTANADALHGLASTLMRQETVQGHELELLLAQVSLHGDGHQRPHPVRSSVDAPARPWDAPELPDPVPAVPFGAPPSPVMTEIEPELGDEPYVDPLTTQQHPAVAPAEEPLGGDSFDDLLETRQEDAVSVTDGEPVSDGPDLAEAEGGPDATSPNGRREQGTDARRPPDRPEPGLRGIARRFRNGGPRRP